MAFLKELASAEQSQCDVLYEMVDTHDQRRIQHEGHPEAQDRSAQEVMKVSDLNSQPMDVSRFRGTDLGNEAQQQGQQPNNAKISDMNRQSRVPHTSQRPPS